MCGGLHEGSNLVLEALWQHSGRVVMDLGFVLLPVCMREVVHHCACDARGLLHAAAST